MIVNQRPFGVEGEVGRFSFHTHQVKKEGEILYNTAESLFPQQRAREKYKTNGFKEMSMIYGTTDQSYRKTTFLINRIRYQEGATPVRTLQDNSETEGKKVIEFMEQKTERILAAHNVTPEGIPRDIEHYQNNEGVFLSHGEITKALESCGVSAEDLIEIKKNPVCYEDSAYTVNISIDDVCVKEQKEKRGTEVQNTSHGNERNFLHNTIAHIQKDGLSYIIASHSIIMAIRIILGFLLNNDLLHYRLQFFLDGQKTLHAALVKAFSWFSNSGILLDWYHLKKKCEMQLSMAMKGRHIRNDVLSQLMPLLWYGMIDKALHYLNSLNQESIKDKDSLDKLINYIGRNRPSIPCYAVRKKLGLRNSSNIGEKMNDLVVSERQKHNGMSWSKPGSVALAALTALKRNEEYTTWFEYKDLKYKFAA